MAKRDGVIARGHPKEASSGGMNAEEKVTFPASW